MRRFKCIISLLLIFIISFVNLNFAFANEINYEDEISIKESINLSDEYTLNVPLNEDSNINTRNILGYEYIQFRANLKYDLSKKHMYGHLM